MILSTHAIVGAAIGSLMPNHPALAFACGMVSHFALDAIPHWDYPLRSISIKPGQGSALRFNWSLGRDLGLISFDALAGLAVALWLYATPAAGGAVLMAALGAMLPDPLQLAHRLCPREPLATVQRFHVWIHSNHRLTWPLGVSTQLSFVVSVVCCLSALQSFMTSVAN